MCTKPVDSGTDTGKESPLETTDVTYDPDTDTYHTGFGLDARGEAAVVSVVDAVAVATDRDVTTLPPLFDSLDPNALSDLVASGRESAITVSFRYEGCTVTVTGEGAVVVDPLDD